MTNEQCEKLNDLFELGYKIKVYTFFVDSFVTAIYPTEIGDKEEWVFCSEVFDEEPLSVHDFWNIQVYKEIPAWYKDNFNMDE